VILVIAATGPDAYATVAVRDLDLGPDRQVEALAVAGGVLTTYNVATPLAGASDVRTWRLHHGVLVLVSATSPPVDWRNATITLPALGACPAGRYTFRDGHAATVDGGPVLSIAEHAAVRYADFDHNGVRDAVVRVDCGTGGPSDQVVVVLTPTGAAAGKTLGVTGRAASEALEEVDEYGVDGETVFVTITRPPGERGQPGVSTLRYRWAGGAFALAS
jgi:hypothetical protein